MYYSLIYIYSFTRCFYAKQWQNINKTDSNIPNVTFKPTLNMKASPDSKYDQSLSALSSVMCDRTGFHSCLFIRAFIKPSRTWTKLSQTTDREKNTERVCEGQMNSLSGGRKGHCAEWKGNSELWESVCVVCSARADLIYLC